MRILFVTRKFPPARGGMERLAHELFQHLSGLADVTLLKWGGSNKWLPLVAPYLFLSSVAVQLLARADVVYLQDGLLAPLGLPLKLFRKPIVATVHGLDITYDNRLYQCIVPACLKRLDSVICVSEATRLECIKRGVPETKTVVIPNGVADTFHVELDDEARNKLRQHVSDRLGLDLVDKKVILSTGRLVERKGFHWFASAVMPKLLAEEKECVYLVVGEGPYRERIQQAAAEVNELRGHVIVLNQADDEMLRQLYNVADIHVLPNMPVKGDMEGFGIVALEASSCCLPVVASRLEGIEQAVKHGQNGYLFEPGNADEAASTVLRLLKDAQERRQAGLRGREFTLRTYSYARIAAMYLDQFQRACQDKAAR
ncbi:MAG: hypothetical protein DRI39_08720 [Chloroflexi bacterium]|nr:MAG: hypothetical protein DRI39_08720 [Chloroflexota bacterium]